MNKIKLEPAKQAEPKVGQLWQSDDGENVYILTAVQQYDEPEGYVCVSLFDGSSETYIKDTLEEAVKNMTLVDAGTIFSIEAGD